MNCLQVWIGEQPSEQIINAMTTVLSLYKENYTLISEYNLFPDEDITWIDYNKYVDNMLKDDVISQFWELIPEGRDHHWCRSDIIRFHYLINNSDTLYLDTDIVLEKRINIGGDINLPKFTRTRYDYFIMYGDSKFFKKILYGAIDNINRILKYSTNLRISRSWILGEINDRQYKNIITPIEGNYEHLALRG